MRVDLGDATQLPLGGVEPSISAMLFKTDRGRDLRGQIDAALG